MALTIPHWDALSQYTFYGTWIESFQDCWWDPEFPQLSQMVQSCLAFLDLCLNVCSPSQVLGDVYTEVLEAAHPLHRGPADHKRSVGPLLSLPEVYNQLFSFAHVQRETVVLAPWCKSLYLTQVCGLIIVGSLLRSSCGLIIVGSLLRSSCGLIIVALNKESVLEKTEVNWLHLYSHWLVTTVPEIFFSYYRFLHVTPVWLWQLFTFSLNITRCKTRAA